MGFLLALPHENECVTDILGKLSKNCGILQGFLSFNQLIIIELVGLSICLCLSTYQSNDVFMSLKCLRNNFFNLADQSFSSQVQFYWGKRAQKGDIREFQASFRLAT